MRLVTRSDFDGLVCAVLLKRVEAIDDIVFVHPKDLQDGKFQVAETDVLTNVPFVPGCGLWFDHHSSEFERVVGKIPFNGECRVAESAARVVYDYYGGEEVFGDIDEMMTAVDKADAAQFSAEEILNPTGWPLLSFVMDARTGLGRYKDYRISNYQLMKELIEQCERTGIDDILLNPDVEERIVRYFEQDGPFRKMLKEHSRTYGSVVVTDLRNVNPILCGNRFMIYALYPGQANSIWMVNGFQNQNCVFACGKSIINKNSATDIGTLMRQFGGGGHEAAGTCQIPHEDADDVLKHLVDQFNNTGKVLDQAA